MALVQQTHSGKLIVFLLVIGVPPQPSWLMEARDPGTGELDSDLRMGEDSADEEAFTCLDPFEHDWDEMDPGLDDPH